MDSCEEDESRSALHSRERGEDDKKRLVQNAFDLPLELVSRIIDHLPSLALFDFRRLCKAAHPLSLLALAHRPFFVLQKNLPSPLCFLLPLDLPCSPLPCSFNLAKPSFRLLLASGNLLCLHRQYALLIDICVCDIFRKWKTVVPPILLPSVTPHIRRHVEDINAESLRVVGFHAGQHTIETHEEEAFSPVYRIFVASATYLRVFDSHVYQWSDPVYFPSHLSAQRSKAPVGFATSDGNLILTFSSKVCAVFNYEDQSFHAMELGFHPSFEVAGYLASADVDSSFNLQVRLPHVEECVRSSPEGGLVLKGSCKSDCDSPYYGSCRIYMGGEPHDHQYSRHCLLSFCHAYQGKVYALVMERDEMHCLTKEPELSAWMKLHCLTKEPELCAWMMERDEMHCLTEEAELRDLLISHKLEGKQWHDISSVDVEKCLRPDKGTAFDCAHFFPACSSRKLTLYSARIDTTKWTMEVSKEADATACVEVFNNEGGTLAFIGG